MTALDQLPTALRAWGLDVVEVTGWQTRRRPGPFTPLGVLIHHTAGPRGKDAPSLQVCIDGRRDLAGPLCQILVARSGKVHVISAGRCNHAGEGGPLANLVPRNLGNQHVVGIEAENDGVGEPWPARQVLAMAEASAAVLDLLGRPRANCWGHKEYTTRKPDPRGIDMNDFRALVIGAVAPGEPTMPTPPKPPTSLVQQWQEMLLANGADLGPSGADGQMGRLTLEASRVVLDHRNQLLAQVKDLEADLASMTRVAQQEGEQRDKATNELADLRKANATSSETIKRLAGERDDAHKATAAALADLRKARQANGTAALAQLIANVEGAVAEARKGLA